MAENKTVDQMPADDWRGLGNFTFNLNREQVIARMEKAEAQRDGLLAICEEVYKEQYRKAVNGATQEARTREPTWSEIQSYLPCWAIQMENEILKARRD